MCLFRQQELGEWDPVIKEVQAALQLWRDAPAARLCVH
jgi:hypothetical protein